MYIITHISSVLTMHSLEDKRARGIGKCVVAKTCRFKPLCVVAVCDKHSSIPLWDIIWNNMHKTCVKASFNTKTKRGH